MLITNGASLGAHKFFNDTPLHLATTRENVDLMRLLIAHGADVNARSQFSWSRPLTCLDIAVRQNSPEAVHLLTTNGARLQTQQQTHSLTNTTLFHLWAEGCGNTNIAEELLAAGCDMDAASGDGQTPLHVAAGKWKCTFRPDAATLNPTNSKPPWPPKLIAQESGSEPALWLLAHKADVNARDNNGQTPLHLIAKTANTNAIQVLLNHHADINARDKNNKTPLALMEDFKIQNHNSRHVLWLTDFRPAEALLLTNGATGEILTPPSDNIHIFK
jgi:cytohesin